MFSLKIFIFLQKTNDMEEIWNDIPDFENQYQASDLGRIKSLDRVVVYSDGRKYSYKSKIIKPSTINSGYNIARLSVNCVCKNFLIHRLVWMAFNGKIPEGMQINHKDENRTNNKLSNLELVTCKENINWGTHKDKQKKAQKNLPVIQYDLNGNFIKEWNGVREVENTLGYYHSNISICCKGKVKTAYGYIWKYKEVA